MTCRSFPGTLLQILGKRRHGRNGSLPPGRRWWRRRRAQLDTTDADMNNGFGGRLFRPLDGREARNRGGANLGPQRWR
jgi:hypothetical protein